MTSALLFLLLLSLTASAASGSAAAAHSTRRHGDFRDKNTAAGALSNKYVLFPPELYSRTWRGGNLITYAFRMPISTDDAYSSDDSELASSTSSPLTGVTMPEIRKAAQDAFAMWSAVVPLSFQEMDNFKDADIVIKFGAIHKDSNALAVTTPITKGDSPFAFRHIIFATDAMWRADETVDERLKHRHHHPELVHHRHSNKRKDYDLQSTLLHEIGHALGLNHNTHLLTSVMYPYQYSKSEYRTFDPDDIAAAQSIYGVPEDVAAPPVATQPPSSSAATAVVMTSSCSWALVVLAVYILTRSS